jgi:acetylglutamate kinase
MEGLTIVKIGGKVIDNELQLAHILADFAQIEGHKILVHGGGTLASEFGKKIGVEPKMIEGRRITDKQSLDVVVMIYAGLINKQIVATLQAAGCNALGLSGADGNSIQAHKRTGTAIDYGFVGDVDKVNDQLLQTLLDTGFSPVFSAITHDHQGQLLNTNADTIAASIASAMAKHYKVKLLITFEQNGVLSDPQQSESIIESITLEEFKAHQQSAVISDGMIPKLDNGFQALADGVDEVLICSFNNIAHLDQPHTELILS